MGELRASFASIDITPDHPASLLGYFTDRVSQGVHDRLWCRLAALGDGERRLLFVQVDTCLMETGDARRLKEQAAHAAGIAAADVVVFASHTHTAPALATLYAVRKDQAYLESLITRVAAACADLGRGRPVEVSLGRSRAPGLASNRRWFLSDGRVATNPPRMHPSLLRPEGPVDDEVNTVFFREPRAGVRAAFVSVSNHTDTTGGTLVSADWPGVMEQEVRRALGAEVIVFPFIGCAGNINHFDFLRGLEQTSPQEAGRLGEAYARAVLASLPCAITDAGVPLASVERVLRVSGVEIGEADLRRARGAAALRGPAGPDHALTAEDIFSGDVFVEQIFARRLIEVSENGQRQHDVPLQLLRAGGVCFFAIPGEPFVETGIALKGMPGISLAVPMGLANGYFGYIPLPECFERGGYEVRPGAALLCRRASEMIVDTFRSMTGEPG